MRMLLSLMTVALIAVLNLPLAEVSAAAVGQAVTTQQELDTAVANAASAGVPVVIDFHADWCGPCQLQKPILKSVSDANPNGVVVLTIDVDQAPQLAQAMQIQSIPTLIQYRSGQEHSRKIGLTQQAELETWLGF